MSQFPYSIRVTFKDMKVEEFKKVILGIALEEKVEIQEDDYFGFVSVANAEYFVTRVVRALARLQMQTSDIESFEICRNEC